MTSETTHRAVWMRRALVALIVVATVVGAALLRLVDLAHQPGGLYPDEAAEGLSAANILHQPGYHPIFIPQNGGREAPFAYLVALGFRLFGETAVVLRGTSAILGTLTVLLLFFALRRYGLIAALTGMAWAAGSLWLIAISRNGMRNMIAPFAATLALWGLLRLDSKPGRAAAALAGAGIGLGFWTYEPLKLLPLLAIVWLWWMRRQQREHYNVVMRHRLALLVGFAVVAGPMLVYAALDPVDYFGRDAATSFANPANGVGTVIAHILPTLGQFGVTGDPVQRHDVSQLPLLPLPLTDLFVVGLVAAWRRRRDMAFALALLGLVVFLLPALLATEGSAPHFLRNLGIAPYVGALLGIGTAALVGRLQRSSASQWLAAGAGAVLFIGVAAGSAHAYFSRPTAVTYEPYSGNVVQLADAAVKPNSLVILDNYSAQDIQFLDYGRNVTIVAPGKPVLNPQGFSLILAGNLVDIRAAVGPELASDAKIAARDPSGQPSVYEVVP